MNFVAEAANSSLRSRAPFRDLLRRSRRGSSARWTVLPPRLFVVSTIGNADGSRSCRRGRVQRTDRRNGDRKIKEEGGFIAVVNYEAASERAGLEKERLERSRSPFKIWPDLGSELNAGTLKRPRTSLQSWPISEQTDEPGIKVSLIGAIHIQTRSTSLTAHRARAHAKLITVRVRRRRIRGGAARRPLRRRRRSTAAGGHSTPLSAFYFTFRAGTLPCWGRSGCGDASSNWRG